MRGGVDPGDLPLGPRVFGIVDVWKAFLSGDWILSSSNAVGHGRCPVGQLSPHAGSVSTANQNSASGVADSTPCGAV